MHKTASLSTGEEIATAAANLRRHALTIDLVQSAGDSLHLFRGYVDDCFFIWTGSNASLRTFTGRLADLDPNTLLLRNKPMLRPFLHPLWPRAGRMRGIFGGESIRRSRGPSRRPGRRSRVRGTLPRRCGSAVTSQRPTCRSARASGLSSSRHSRHNCTVRRHILVKIDHKSLRAAFSPTSFPAVPFSTSICAVCHRSGVIADAFAHRANRGDPTTPVFVDVQGIRERVTGERRRAARS